MAMADDGCRSPGCFHLHQEVESMHRELARWGCPPQLPWSLVLGSLLLWVPTRAPAQVTADQAAALVLNSARKAYNDKEYPFAVTRFREFLAKYGNHKDVPAARYGLAVALFELPEPDFQGALEQLQPLAGSKELPDYPFVLYHLGLAQRGLGIRELAVAIAKPQEASQRRAAAQQRFDEAAKHFTAAAEAFAGRAKAPAPEAKEPPLEWEWAARARCDLAEMQLRTLKAKEAQATAAALLKDSLAAKSRYHGLALYHQGLASLALKEYAAAIEALSRLQPFQDPVYGTHARYLLGRALQLNGQGKAAASHYDAVLAAHEKDKKDAIEALKKPEALKDDPAEKRRLEGLVRDPAPDHVAKAGFFGAVLLYEGGRPAEALARFGAFPQQYPGSPLMPEAQLRVGFCQVRLKQYAGAIQNLQSLADKEPALADQATFWMAKAQIGAADPGNAAAYQQALQTAMDTLRRAAERAQQLAGTDPTAKERRGEILLDLADTLQLAKQYAQAANSYAQVLNERLLPARDEELLERLAGATHRAGDYAQSDQLCTRFQQTYPKSPLLPAIALRYAENAYFAALAADKNPNLANRAAELARLFTEAAQRYSAVVDKYPTFSQINLARYGLAVSLYRKGDSARARELLEAIPAAQRTGELAVVSYALADILLHTRPGKSGQAPPAEQTRNQVQTAATLLETFLGGQPAAPQAPDALLKLGYCQQRLASLAPQASDRAKFLGNARGAYERLLQQFANDPLRAEATLERARCLEQAGDLGGAMNELQRFQSDPFKSAPLAPVALLQLATWLRGQNKSADAANILSQCRQQHEQSLVTDSIRASWVPLLQYQHGLCLQEAGKFADARAVFDLVVKQGPSRPEAAEAALHISQCFREEGSLKLAAAREALAKPGAKPDELAAATRTLDEGLQLVRMGTQTLEGPIAQLQVNPSARDVRARMLYESAWEYRLLAQPEVAAARGKLQQEEQKKLTEEAAKKNPGAAMPAIVEPPLVARAAVPVQPAEQKARAQYKTLIASAPETPLAGEGRFELAELLAERAEYDTAIKLLGDALDKEPLPELADRLRLRLGACYADKGDSKNALAQFDAVAQNSKSPFVGQAHYRAGECWMRLTEWNKAAARLAVFRDQGPFQNLPDLTDRALLRLGQALAHAGQWDQSRQAHEILVARFGNSPWILEARYGIGWAWQNQKQLDNAINAYTQVTAVAATEIAARAQLQIGLCHREQKRYPEAIAALLVVPFTFDYAELSALALCEAARTLVETNQTDQAARLLHRVIQDHPRSKWADVARERLAALPGS
jgi:tetratricopeptide (TPR) repeat protein